MDDIERLSVLRNPAAETDPVTRLTRSLSPRGTLAQQEESLVVRLNVLLNRVSRLYGDARALVPTGDTAPASRKVVHQLSNLLMTVRCLRDLMETAPRAAPKGMANEAALHRLEESIHQAAVQLATVSPAGRHTEHAGVRFVRPL